MFGDSKINIPDTWGSLAEFVVWYKQNNFPIMPPADMQIYVTDVSYSAIVFRRDRYQVEMYMIKPDSVIVEHSHDFDLQLIHLGGSIKSRSSIASVEGQYGIAKPKEDNLDLPHQDYGKVSNYLPAGEKHSFYTLRNGSMLFNIEMWKPKIEMSSATENYIGEPLGPLHEKTLSKT